VIVYFVDELSIFDGLNETVISPLLQEKFVGDTPPDMDIAAWVALLFIGFENDNEIVG
jgi:hypothetical protein